MSHKDSNVIHDISIVDTAKGSRVPYLSAPHVFNGTNNADPGTCEQGLYVLAPLGCIENMPGYLFTQYIADKSLKIRLLCNHQTSKYSKIIHNRNFAQAKISTATHCSDESTELSQEIKPKYGSYATAHSPNI